MDDALADSRLPPDGGDRRLGVDAVLGLIWDQAPGRINVAGDNDANRTLSKPSPGEPGDAGNFASFSKQNGVPLHAAVIGSDGSISYWDGGAKVEDYEERMRVVVAPKGTIPMINPN